MPNDTCNRLNNMYDSFDIYLGFSLTFSAGSWWLGQNDQAEERVWRYSTTPTDCSTTGVYLNWISTYPDGETRTNTMNKDCGSLHTASADGFRDKKCSAKAFSICKTTPGKFHP